MKRVYVAGAYSANDTLTVLKNIGRGIRAGLDVFCAGYAPFVPWLDYHFSLYSAGEKLSVQDYYDYSLAWLEVSDAMLVLPDYEHSKGTLLEIERANVLSIPVFYTMEALCRNLPRV